MKFFVLFLCFTLSFCGNYHENELWGQPCGDDKSVPSSDKSAEEVVRYTSWIHEHLDSYKDAFIRKLDKHHASFHEYFQFTEGLNKQWLRQFYWFIEEQLPKEKFLFQPVPGQVIQDIASRTNNFNDVMPKITAASKFILGTIYVITKQDSYADIMNLDLDLRRSIRESMRIHRSIICSMENYLKDKNLEVHVLLDDFLPKSIPDDLIGRILRDAFNYFEYINQLFETIKNGKEVIVLLDDPRPSWMQNKSADEWKYKLLHD